VLEVMKMECVFCNVECHTMRELKEHVLVTHQSEFPEWKDIYFPGQELTKREKKVLGIRWE